MSFKIDHVVAVMVAIVLNAVVSVSGAFAQAGEVMEDGEDNGAVEATDEPGAGRITPGDADEVLEGDDSVDEAADADDDDPTESKAMEYRVGAENLVEVGGHILVSYFTTPSLPELNAGLGFQGRVATRVWGDLVGEGNVGIMFNPDRGGQATYKTATLRAGARLPIDLHAKPVLFFVGAGAALDIFWVTTVATTGEELSSSGVAPAFDLQFGLIFEVAERLAIEAIVQATYAFPTVVLGDNDASWLSLLGGVSYDL